MTASPRDLVRWHAANPAHHGPPWHARSCPVCEEERARRERHVVIPAMLRDARLHPFGFVLHVAQRMARGRGRSAYLAVLRRVAHECVAEARELRQKPRGQV